MHKRGQKTEASHQVECSPLSFGEKKPYPRRITPEAKVCGCTELTKRLSTGIDLKCLDVLDEYYQKRKYCLTRFLALRGAKSLMSFRES
jgi:hypothetical protein